MIRNYIAGSHIVDSVMDGGGVGRETMILKYRVEPHCRLSYGWGGRKGNDDQKLYSGKPHRRLSYGWGGGVGRETMILKYRVEVEGNSGRLTAKAPGGEP